MVGIPKGPKISLALNEPTKQVALHLNSSNTSEHTHHKWRTTNGKSHGINSCRKVYGVKKLNSILQLNQMNSLIGEEMFTLEM